MTPNRRFCPLDRPDYVTNAERVPGYWTDCLRRHWLDIGTVLLCSIALACCVTLIWLSLLVMANWEWLR